MKKVLKNGKKATICAKYSLLGSKDLINVTFIFQRHKYLKKE